MGEKARILVTGAGGFLGSHICHYFGSRQHQIGAVGRFSSPLSWSSLYPNLEMFWGLTLPDAQFAYVLQAFRPDVVVHAAGTASVPDSVADPYGDFQKTVEVCAFTLEMIRRHAPHTKFILLSSAAVYGNPQILPISEASEPSSISPYAYHKRICETLTEEYSQLHGIRSAVLRIFSAYGERLRRQVVHDIASKMIDPDISVVELFGTGDESRDFVHGVDVGQAIERILHAESEGVFNIGSGSDTSIRDLSKILAEGLKCRKKIVFNGRTRSGDPVNWRADISKLTAIGFKPSVTLDLGLKKYCSWLQTEPTLSNI